MGVSIYLYIYISLNFVLPRGGKQKRKRLWYPKSYTNKKKGLQLIQLLQNRIGGYVPGSLAVLRPHPGLTMRPGLESGFFFAIIM